MFIAVPILVSLLLAGCGTDLCVGNMGDCERVNKTTNPGRPSSDEVEIKSPSPRVRVNERVQLTASGGTPPYRFSLIQGGGVIDESSGVYNAPSTPGAVVIRVIDSKMTVTSPCEKCEIPLQVVN